MHNSNRADLYDTCNVQKVGNNYTSLFDSVADAANAVYNLEYSDDKTRERAIYLGYSIVVKVGATDLTDPNNFAIVGMLPQALDGFTNSGGQTGGGTGAYIPMQVATFNDTSFTAKNNYKNVASATSASPITVKMPSPTSGIVNQLEVEYVHSSSKGGLSVVDQDSQAITWWVDAPQYQGSRKYLIICEYVGGSWMAGYFEK